MAGHGLRRTDRQLVGVLAEHRFDRVDFRQVACRGRSPVSVDVLDLIRANLGIAQRVGDAAGGAGTVFRWRRHVECVAAHAETDQFGIDSGAASSGVFQLFENQGPGTVRQHETVTTLVPRTAGAGRLVIAGRQRTRCAESAHAQTAGSHFGATGNHHIGFVISNVTRGHANAVGARGTRGGNGVVWPLSTQMDRQETGNHVDDRPRHEERGNLAGPLLMQQAAGVFNVGQPADARSHGNADAFTVCIGDFDARVAHCLKAGSQTVLNE